MSRISCPKPSLRGLVLALQAAVLLPALTSLSQPVLAQARAEALQRFDIPAGPLAEALTRYGVQAGLVLSIDASLVRGLQTQGLRADMGKHAALQALLQGSGLVPHYAAQGVVSLRQAPKSGEARTLSTLRVQGESAGAQAARLHASPREAAAAVYTEARPSVYISGEHLERYRGSSPADMLKGQPGVNTGDARNGHGLDVNIRGLQGQGRVAVVVDGTQQSMTVARGYAGQQDRAYLDPDLISSVQIEKGPGLQLDAPSAIAGVVSMQTLGADDVLSAGQTQGLRLRVGVADSSVSPQTGFRVTPRSERNSLLEPHSHSASLAAAKRWQTLDLLGAYTRRVQGNYFAGTRHAQAYAERDRTHPLPPVLANYHAGEEVLNTHSKTESLLLKARWRPTTAHDGELVLRHSQGEYAEVMPSALLRTSPKDKYTAPNTQVQYEPGTLTLTALSASHLWQPAGQDWLKLKSQLWFTRADSLMYNAYLGTVPVDPKVPGSGRGESDDPRYKQALRHELRSDRWGLQLGNTARWFPADGALKLDLGLSWQQEDTGGSDELAALKINQERNRYVRGGLRKELGLMAALEWQPNEQWTLQGGLRHQQYATRDHNRFAFTKWEDSRYRVVTLQSGGKPIPNGKVHWRPDAQGNFTPSSLAASAHGSGTVKDLGAYDEPRISVFRPLPQFGSRKNLGIHYEDRLERSASALAPTLNLAYKFYGESQVYARYAEGFKMPSLVESTVGNPYTKPARELAPEHNRSWDLGLSHIERALFAPGDQAMLKLGWFSNSIKNAITRVALYESSGFEVANTPLLETAGWELQGRYENARLMGEASATYYTRARSCNAAHAQGLRNAPILNDDRLAQTPDCVDGGFGSSFTPSQNPPRLSLSASLAGKFLQQALTLGGRAVYHSEPLHRLNDPWHTFAANGAQQYYQSSSTLDLFADYKLGKHSQLQLAVDNLLDRYALDPLALSSMPAPGRRVRLDLSFSF